MQIEVFCLCKSATVNSLNQPTLTDIFDTKLANGEPALIEESFLVLSIRAYRSDEGQHRFSVRCEDKNGNTLLGPIVDVVAFSDLTRDSTTFFHVYTVPAAKLSFGVYRFSIEIDGKPLAHTPLYVTHERFFGPQI